MDTTTLLIIIVIVLLVGGQLAASFLLLRAWRRLSFEFENALNFSGCVNHPLVLQLPLQGIRDG